ncbi:putative colanic acid biosynthesis UDP-glucose lipid carrier transferase [Oceanihabitans sediminis]|uniref:Undecaprenyl-phosphate glucose phosphotransferase n=1 Tax=Oceanihabitans sediminis TaxID=1812012 RepID=A0A368P658_9FLAO|nr:undecaprenyl-phosphate glucose phosphotransferase [Oceanihabitans sediminis]RBP34659.1 putative colanic acid biosynthesis UDP-glucose lipid carrier transferase [Oceanihabitans sediminis]RCU58312.1 undecaprenyl-phosphate glucose phosphotransferase [Oceanihabitans sediminis]
MSTVKPGRYSVYLRPISYFIDLSIINGLALLCFFKSVDPVSFVFLISIAWVVISLYSNFYAVFRYTKEVLIISLILRQMALFTLVVFAFSGLYYKINILPETIFKYVGSVFLLISIFKFALYYLLQRYRVSFGGNFRITAILGKNKQTQALEEFFTENPEYGYSHTKTFSFKNITDEEIEACFRFIKEEKVDEIYCSLSQLTNSQLNKVVDFADNNLKLVKFLPDNKDVYSKKLKYEYYDYIPILSLRNIPLEDSVNQFVKRAFDIVFSSLVIVFFLSWLTPLIAILIKLESKGPVFFKQSRNGFNYKEFECYKFRSMMPNKNAHLHQATRGDQRVTRVGKFIRKTSIDELPQFYNVLFGDMSVVGPRPHMVSHTNMYAKKIDKFMVRHFVKPGITGLAQISGYRGEVETDKDIIGRVKYDIFYIENWSLLLDFKIILKTLINTIRGEEKAY